MDDKDKKIIDFLKKDGNATTREIAKKTLVPITTVHKRIKKLKEKGIIKRYTIELDYSQLEKGLGSIILVSLDSAVLKKQNLTPKEFTVKLSSFDHVDKAFHVTGICDIVLVTRVKDTVELEDFLYRLKTHYPAIERTQTLVVLSET